MYKNIFKIVKIVNHIHRYALGDRSLRCALCGVGICLPRMKLLGNLLHNSFQLLPHLQLFKLLLLFVMLQHEAVMLALEHGGGGRGCRGQQRAGAGVRVFRPQRQQYQRLRRLLFGTY